MFGVNSASVEATLPNPPRRIEGLGTHLLQSLGCNEDYPHTTTFQQASICLRHDLEFLRVMMGCSVILCSGEQPDVVGVLETLH